MARKGKASVQQQQQHYGTSPTFSGTSEVGVRFEGQYLNTDQPGYASQLLFSDIIGGPVDPTMFNGYMWNASGGTSPTFANYGPTDPHTGAQLGDFSRHADDVFDFSNASRNEDLENNQGLYPLFGQAHTSTSIDRSNSNSETLSSHSNTPFGRNM